MTLGEKIKEERNKLQISQLKLGEFLSVTQQAVGKWERNLAEPDASNLKKLSELFHVSTDYLLGCDSNLVHKKNQQTISPQQIKSAESDIQLIYDALNPRQQAKLLAYAEGLLAANDLTPNDSEMKF